MEKTRIFIKLSIFKYILLTILLVVIIYFFSYLKPEKLHYVTNCESLFEYYKGIVRKILSIY